LDQLTHNLEREFKGVALLHDRLNYPSLLDFVSRLPDVRIEGQRPHLEVGKGGAAIAVELVDRALIVKRVQ